MTPEERARLLAVLKDPAARERFNKLQVTAGQLRTMGHEVPKAIADDEVVTGRGAKEETP